MLTTTYFQRQGERDNMVFGRPMRGDYEHFEGMDATTLAALVAEGFADAEETQNDSPAIAEFLEFMAAHPWAKAHGYLIGAPRDDIRVSVEGVEGYAPNRAEERALHEFGGHADETTFFRDDNYCRVWWD